MKCNMFFNVYIFVCVCGWVLHIITHTDFGRVNNMESAFRYEIDAYVSQDILERRAFEKKKKHTKHGSKVNMRKTVMLPPLSLPSIYIYII